MYYFQRVEERSKQARKALKNCELAQRQKKFGFKEAVISSRGECTGCRNPDDGALDRKCKRCQYNEYYEAKCLRFSLRRLHMQSLCEQRGNDRQLHRRSKRTLLRMR